MNVLFLISAYYIFIHDGIWVSVEATGGCSGGSEANCANIPKGERFDCFPRGVPDEKSCTSKGCCWISTTEESLDPPCFFPKNFRSYVVSNSISESSSHRRLTLQVTQPTDYRYPDTIDTAKVEINYETKSRLRINITDAESQRFKPPYPELPVSSNFTGDTDYKVLINEDPFGFAIVRKKTQTVIFDTRGVGGLTLANQFLQISSIIPSKYLYGLGERRNHFLINTTWETITLFNYDSFPQDNTNLYGSHPFYIAVENDGYSHGIFLLNSNAMDIIVQPAPAITYRTIGGVLDFYFFLGPTPADVIKQYLEVIGKPMFPPYWSLGFHLCRWGWKTLDDTIAAWRRNREAKIPFDVQWNDIDYMEGNNDFIINSNFKGLRHFIDELHEVGMKYIIIIDPGVASEFPRGSYPPYDEGIKQDIFIKNSSGLPSVGTVWNDPEGTVFPDFSNPRTASYWFNLIDELHKKVPYDGLWLDMNEISNFNNGSRHGCPENNALDNPPYKPHVSGDRLNAHTLCMSDKHEIGPHYDVHNIHGFLECITTFQCLEKITQKRPFILSRSTFSGSGHYVAHWTGDVLSEWEEMKHSVTDIINFNLFGIPMVGADICGFVGNTTKELCQRWSQLGAFYPFSRNHNEELNMDQDPAIWGPEFVESTRRALITRYRLLPYLYTLFWKAHQFGETVLRPLFFEFTTDENTLTIDTEFLWGPAMLIVPVLTQGATSVDAYFPEGLWFSIEMVEEMHESKGEYRTISAPLDKIPIYLRGGHIIPWQEPDYTTFASRQKPFGLYIVLDQRKRAAGSLFWDDGESYGYRDNGQYNLLEFICNDWILASTVSNWGYNVTMKMNTILLSGLPGEVRRMSINYKEHHYFSQMPQNKLLIIQFADIDLSTPFTVTWIYKDDIYN